MAYKAEINTKTNPSAQSERQLIPDEDEPFDDRGCKEVIDQLQQVLKLPSNISSSGALVSQIRHLFHQRDEIIDDLNKKEKDHEKLLNAVKDITHFPSDCDVETMIYQLHATWRRHEATRIIMKKKLDRIKEKLSSKGSSEDQCGLISENATLRKQCSEMKKRFDQLMQEYKRVKDSSSGQHQILFEEAANKGTGSGADLTVANRPCGETKPRVKATLKNGNGIFIENQNTNSEKDENSDESFRITKEEQAILHFENENNKDMVARLRQTLSAFHQSIIIRSGTLQVAPVSKIDQAVLAMFSKIPVKRIDQAMLQLWKNRATDTAEEVVIGKGAFGKVTLMRYIPTNIPVAVKIQERKNRGMMISDDEMKNKLISRSMKEAIMHHVMSDNPSFPGLLGVVEIEENLGIVLEFVGDKRFTIIHPLCDVLFERRPGLSRLEWIDIALDIIQGLASLHDKGLLHNDLKKNNILLQRSGERWRAYIIDFGHGSTITMPLKFPTFTLEEEREYLDGLLYHHLAPEIIKDQQPTSVYTDIYSLGKVILDIGRVSGDRDIRLLAEMCTKEKPYRRPTISNIELSVMRSKQRVQQ